MDKRYQVFVSSTYADLKEERSKVIQTLMEMDCIPSGMELFPAADEEQFNFIKRVIDDCDYYVLIIGGRYGSTTSEGVSYTELEYDYAISQGLKVLAFVHENPDEIPSDKTDKNPALLARLRTFRDKVSSGRLVKQWRTASDLPGMVALSLQKAIKSSPAKGWVRADQVASAEILTEINDLRKRNSELEQFQRTYETERVKPTIKNIAGLDEKIELTGSSVFSGTRYPWKCSLSWKELFALLSPYLLDQPNEALVILRLGPDLVKKAKASGSSITIEDQLINTIKIQYAALGLMRVDFLKTMQGGMALFWSLTKKGSDLMMELRSIKTNR